MDYDDYWDIQTGEGLAYGDLWDWLDFEIGETITEDEEE